MVLLIIDHIQPRIPLGQISKPQAFKHDYILSEIKRHARDWFAHVIGLFVYEFLMKYNNIFEIHLNQQWLYSSMQEIKCVLKRFKLYIETL